MTDKSQSVKKTTQIEGNMAVRFLLKSSEIYSLNKKSEKSSIKKKPGENAGQLDHSNSMTDQMFGTTAMGGSSQKYKKLKYKITSIKEYLPSLSIHSLQFHKDDEQTDIHKSLALLRRA